MYKLIFTSQFKKDVKLLKRQGKDLNKLNKVLTCLINNEILSENYKEHKLSGKYSKYNECHIEPDWLLIFIRDNENQEIVLVSSGSHAQLF